MQLFRSPKAPTLLRDATYANAQRLLALQVANDFDALITLMSELSADGDLETTIGLADQLGDASEIAALRTLAAQFAAGNETIVVEGKYTAPNPNKTPWWKWALGIAGAGIVGYGGYRYSKSKGWI